MKLRILLILSATLATLAAAPAVHSDTILSGHAGWVFGGDRGFVFLDEDEANDLEEGAFTYGGALTFMGDGPVGFEIEGAYTPDLFTSPREGFFDDNNVSSLMANILIGSNIGERGKIFLTVGGGILKTQVADVDDFFEIDSTDFGASAGLGAIGYFSDHVGVRGDVRYYRNFGEDPENEEFDLDFGDFSFWRGTAGLAFRF